MIITILLSGPSTLSSSAVIVAVPVVEPCAIATVPPPLTVAPAAADTVTVTPPEGAAAGNVTVAVVESPSSIDVCDSASDSAFSSSSIVSVAGLIRKLTVLHPAFISRTALALTVSVLSPVLIVLFVVLIVGVPDQVPPALVAARVSRLAVDKVTPSRLVGLIETSACIFASTFVLPPPTVTKFRVHPATHCRVAVTDSPSVMVFELRLTLYRRVCDCACAGDADHSAAAASTPAASRRAKGFSAPPPRVRAGRGKAAQASRTRFTDISPDSFTPKGAPLVRLSRAGLYPRRPGPERPPPAAARRTPGARRGFTPPPPISHARGAGVESRFQAWAEKRNSRLRQAIYHISKPAHCASTYRTRPGRPQPPMQDISARAAAVAVL